MSLDRALKERIEWGKAFAETRAEEASKARLILLLLGSPVLPFILFHRAVKNMLRQKRRVSQITRLSPLIFAFVLFWSIGEAIGYLTHTPKGRERAAKNLETSVSSTH